MLSKKTINEKIYMYGEEILSSEGMRSQRGFMQHGRASVYEHSLSVAAMCIRLSRLLPIKTDERSLVRGALLHDYFLYDWHVKDGTHRMHGFHHARRAMQNAERDFGLNLIEKNMISSHMFPLGRSFPRYRESLILFTADKICAANETMTGLLSKIKK